MTASYRLADVRESPEPDAKLNLALALAWHHASMSQKYALSCYLKQQAISNLPTLNKVNAFRQSLQSPQPGG